MDAIDKVRETAEAMARVFIIEVMGRHAGFYWFTRGHCGCR